jgi:aspartyl-tRNA(Asn)/glutamyl-tRNA(Gln) amidotransferase subunit A
MTTTDTSSAIARIARALADGETSAVATVDECLERSLAAQLSLNAFTLLDVDGAHAAAARLDARRDAGESVGPLAGVPIAVKDLIDQSGLPNTCGAGFTPEVPQESAPCVSRLEAADAVMVGRTGLHEFAFGFSSENDWFGPVRNPWDASISPGGSSGGSAAAVAAALVPGALGTDTGGSVRVPAALCGVVGLKVTHGRIPIRGVYPLAPSIDTVGPITRTVADAGVLYRTMAGDDPADPWSVPIGVDAARGPADLSQLRFGIPLPWTEAPMVPEVRHSFDQVCGSLAAAGAEVIELHLPELDLPGKLLASVYFEVAAVHRERWHEAPDAFGPDVSRRLADVFTYRGDDYLEALAWRRSCRAAADRALATVDALITPTVAALRKPIGEETIEVAGREVSYRSPLSHFTALVNHIGLPALALPLNTPGTPPPSLQVIGAAWSEETLLSIGLALEQAALVAAQTPPDWAP